MTSTRSAAATGLPSQQPAFLDPRTFPDIYGLAVAGNCMAPAYPDGCTVKVSKSELYSRNDVVALWWRPEIVAAGAAPCMIKRVVFMPADWVKSYPYKDNPKSEVLAVIMLGRDDQPDKMLRIRCSDILAIHKVVGRLAEEDCYDARPEAPLTSNLRATQNKVRS